MALNCFCNRGDGVFNWTFLSNAAAGTLDRANQGGNLVRGGW